MINVVIVKIEDPTEDPASNEETIYKHDDMMI